MHWGRALKRQHCRRQLSRALFFSVRARGKSLKLIIKASRVGLTQLWDRCALALGRSLVRQWATLHDNGGGRL